MRKFCDVMHKYGLLAVIFIMIVAGIIIRLKLILFNQSLWSDECSLYLNISKFDYWQFFKPLAWFQVAPPIFMVIEKFFFDLFKNVLPMEMSLRLFPLFCSIATLFLLPFFVEKVYKNRTVTAITTFITAFTPYVANYSSEVKQYSCELFVSILLFMFFSFFDIKKFSKKKLVIFSIIISLAPLLSLSSFFVTVAGAVVIFYNLYINRKEINLKEYSLCYFIPFVIIEISIYFLLIKPIYDDKYTELVFYWSFVEPSMFTLSSFYGKFSKTTFELMGDFFSINYSFWHLFFWGSLVLLLIRNNIKLSILLLGSLAVTIFVSFAHLYPYDCRLILFLFPVFAIIYMQLFLFLDKKCFSPIIVIGLLVATIIASGYSTESYIIHKTKIREVCEDLKKVNPELKNVIGPEGGLETYSDGLAVLGVNIWEKFDEKIFIEDVCSMPYDTYYIFLADDTPFNDDLRKMLKTSKDIVQIPISSPDNREYTNIIKIRNDCAIKTKK